MTLQIETNRGIAAQILRHRSFTFQEFSQRYADSTQLGNIPVPDLRRQDKKNRQNSTSDLPEEVSELFKSKIHDHGCAFKILKKNIIDDFTNWGDFHRLLAARLADNGYNIKEIIIN